MMKILEVRDGFIKFEADNSIYLSSFVQIDGMEKSYVAQVIQIKRSGTNSIAYAKILFLYDGTLQSYDKTLPSKESEIKEFTYDILNNSIDAPNPVIAGKTLGDGVNIVIDSSAFDKKMLISVDDKNDNNIIVRNLTKQFNNLKNNVIIIDTLGIVNAQKYTAGIDFKLPLDTASLAFMYEDCLNDATADSKSLIIEIFKDLAEYSKTVPFVPFEALKQIVFDMVDNSHVFKLLVLKNKLAKFDRLGYFAKNKNEVDSIDNILNKKTAVIDLSKLDTAFLNRYLEFIYEKLQNSGNTQVLLELSNTVNKKNLKKILTSEDIPTTFITHSKFKYLNDIKNLFDNFIISPSFANNNIFNIYSTFLNAMQKNSYLLAGEATNYIPLVSRLELINDTIEINNSELEEISEYHPAVISEPAEETEAPALEEEITTEGITEEIPEETAGENLETAEIEESLVQEEYAEPENAEPISAENILSNIEERSEDIITSAIDDLAPPENMVMFGDEEEESEEPEQPASEEIQEEVMQDEEPILEESDLEDREEFEDEEEVSLLDSFETEVHPNEEIQDYVPQEEQEPVEEISLEEALEEDNQLIEEFSQEEVTEEPEAVENLEDLNDTTAIELDDDIDLDLEPAQEEIPEVPQELEQDDEISIMPIANSEFDEFDEITELNPDEADENDIVIDMDDSYEELPPDDIDAQIVKDVDKVFTTRKDETDISDSDLDFIDELNNDTDNILEELSDSSDSELEELALPEPDEDDGGILEEIQEPAELKDKTDDGILETKNSSTPIVPVYDADIPQEDLVVSDPIQQGDTVTHVKYGTGVVEKMIKYGNKTLFSINFDNIGRRLLDPTLTEIKKS